MNTNDNNITTLPAIDNASLPAEYRGRVTVIIEIREGTSINMNGIELSLSDGAALIRKMANVG